jgi:hypothetical protein
VTDQPDAQSCGGEKPHPAHRFMIGRQVRQCPGQAETPSALREQAIDAVAQALNAGRYWLPAAGQAAAVDAVLALTGAELEASQRRGIAFGERIDAARAWARQHLDAEQQAGLLAVLRGDQLKETPDA